MICHFSYKKRAIYSSMYVYLFVRKVLNYNLFILVRMSGRVFVVWIIWFTENTIQRYSCTVLNFSCRARIAR